MLCSGNKKRRTKNSQQRNFMFYNSLQIWLGLTASSVFGRFLSRWGKAQSLCFNAYSSGLCAVCEWMRVYISTEVWQHTSAMAWAQGTFQWGFNRLEHLTNVHCVSSHIASHLSAHFSSIIIYIVQYIFRGSFWIDKPSLRQSAPKYLHYCCYFVVRHPLT